MEQRNTEAKLRLITSIVLFGTIGVFVRSIPLPSSAIALVRGVVGALFLLVFCLLRGKKLSVAAIRRHLGLLCLSGAAIGVNWMLLFEAYRYTTVATATLCYYMAPVFVVIASTILFREKLSGSRALCVLLALVGVALVSGILTQTPTAGEYKGILFGLSAAVLYAFVILLNKRLTGLGAYEKTIVQLGTAALVMLPYVLLTESLSVFRLTPVPAVLLLVVGVVHTGVSYALYFSAVTSLPAQTTALLSYIDPVVAVLLSVLVLGEPLGVTGGIGSVLVLGSALLDEMLARRGTGKTTT